MEKWKKAMIERSMKEVHKSASQSCSFVGHEGVKVLAGELGGVGDCNWQMRIHSFN